ncbi:nSTAND1 domain-containing NTPase [Planomonospora algeriensis]
MKAAPGADGGAAGPYVGLRPYRETEHDLFFGREREAREIATIWQATGLTVLYGTSGVGKTSLLHAGVLPRIEAERADVLPIARVSPRGIAAPSRGPGRPARPGAAGGLGAGRAAVGARRDDGRGVPGAAPGTARPVR